MEPEILPCLLLGPPKMVPLIVGNPCYMVISMRLLNNNLRKDTQNSRAAKNINFRSFGSRSSKSVTPQTRSEHLVLEQASGWFRV